MAERARHLNRPHPAQDEQMQQHAAAADRKQHERRQVQQQRRHLLAEEPQEEKRPQYSAQPLLQRRSQPTQVMKLQRPFSSVHPTRRLSEREHQQLDCSECPKTSCVSACKNLSPVVLFDTSKEERGDPSSTYKQLARRLQEQGMQCDVNLEGNLTHEKLEHASLIVLACPSQPFSSSEMETLKEFLEGGKSILAMLGEGGEQEARTNINYFLEEYGLTICSDAVVRTVVAGSDHLHPKETLISDGFLCRELDAEMAQEHVIPPSASIPHRQRSGETCNHLDTNANSGHSSTSNCRDNSSPTCNALRPSHTGPNILHTSNLAPDNSSTGSDNHSGADADSAGECGRTCKTSRPPQTMKSTVSFVFPYGATVSVQAPAFPFLSSGMVAFPPRRPLGGAYISPSDGRLIALGSYRFFDDHFLFKEGNPRLQQLIFAWLLHRQPAEALKLKRLDQMSYNTGSDSGTVQAGNFSVETELTERSQAVPDTASMADRVMPCFQESEYNLPADFRDLYEEKLYSVNLDMLPEVKRVYKQLNVKYEPLSMIKPEFEVPLPPLIPAVHPPLRMEVSPPPLELFDLDELLASPRTRLAHLTNRCTDVALTYYVREAADIVGFSEAEQDIAVDDEKAKENVAKDVLWRAFAEIIAHKFQHAPGAANTVTEAKVKSHSG